MNSNPGDAACEPESGAVKDVFRLFGEGDELYAEMVRSIRTASQRIFLASYILAADEVGAELLVDEAWDSIGTANFDYRSLFINYELTLISTNEARNGQLRNEFKTDLQDASEITGITRKHRGFIKGVYDTLGLLLRKWL